MLADLFTKIVTTAQDKRLAIRFYTDCVDKDGFVMEEIMMESLVKATDKYEAAIAMQPEATYRNTT
jgi:hypothetical protein